jgi:hypothetical protein
MGVRAKATPEQRKAYLRQIIQHTSLEDIFGEERKRQWDAFSTADKQKVEESKVFVGFVSASGLSCDPYDHENQDPPLPDIRATIAGKSHYFELGEITDQGLAWATGDLLKTGEITGCPFSQLDPLLKMFRSKCTTQYQTAGNPVDLLLFYSTQHPYEPLLYQHLNEFSAEITGLVANSQFSRVWLYSDYRPQRVLWNLIR